MNEKENYNTKEPLLKEAYEMTNNQWHYMTVNELNIAVGYRINNRQDFKRDWIRKAAFDENKQLEVIHLIYLIDKVDLFNIGRLEEQLKLFNPNPINNIQPLYIPEQESFDPKLLQVELDSGYKLIVTQSSFLFKTPTEI